MGTYDTAGGAPLSPHDEDSGCPWAFELVDGKCITHLEGIELNEATWNALVEARRTFMQPIWKQRQDAQDEAQRAEYAARENLKQHTEIICGVEVTIFTKGSQSEPYRAEVADRIKTSRGFGKTRPYEVEILTPPTKGQTKPRWITLRKEDSYAPRSFKTVQAAVKAALEEDKPEAGA